MATKEQLLSALRDSLDESGRQWLEQAVGRAARGSLDDLLRGVHGGLAAHWQQSTPRRSGRSGRRACVRPVDARGRGPRAPAADARGELPDHVQGRRGGVLRAWATRASSKAGCARVALLPGPEQFLPIAVDACRTNILPLFEAIACENPYPDAVLSRTQLQPDGPEGDVQRRRAGAHRRAGSGGCNAELSRMANGLRRRTPSRWTFRSRRSSRWRCRTAPATEEQTR